MDQIGVYTDNVSSFGSSAIAALLLLVMSWAFSAIHILEEWKGSQFPLWRAFGAIDGVYLPNWLGFLFFTVLLWLILWVIAAGAIIGRSLGGPLTAEQGMFLLGALIGALVSDCVFSHWIPYVAGYRPNPGVRSTTLYVLEAVVLVWLFRKGLSAHPPQTVVGGLLGVLFFLAVWGVLVALRLCFPFLRRPPWVGGEAIPPWAAS
jgi:hypothetical protein